jgi:acyl transferase domain-containing protein/surfactin synthase thioesterase subunit
MSEQQQPDDENAVAIIGMACRFPGGRTVDEFWDNILNGRESITRFSREQLLAAGVPQALIDDPDYIPAKGVIGDAYAFDAPLFGYSAAEARILDPQQRIFLQCAWEALESAGYAPRGVPVPTGVFAGCATSTHMSAVGTSHHEGATAQALRVLTANDKDYLATRVSYKLDLNGPSLTVQTACSTSLVAVHLAVQSLLSGECGLALAGGAMISLPQEAGYLHEEGMTLSPDGHCRSYDERAAGFVTGNGAGIVLLKRLTSALSDGDHIWAILRGSAVNNDGADKIGFSAPSVKGQARVIAEALAVAAVSADSIGYLEGQGTATAIGDPIEVQALTRAFRQETDRRGFCALGSVKSNIGLLESAAGVASLIKGALIAYHGEIPPSIHFERPNPKMELDTSPFYVPTKRQPWPGGAAPRRVGVSSFGVGGTNAHVILEQPPHRTQKDAPPRGRPILTLSALSEERLSALADRYREHLGRSASPALADLAYTTNVGRHHFSRRLAILASSADEVRGGLQGSASRVFRSQASTRAGIRPVFLFSGQGAQYAGMAKVLYDTYPGFRAAFRRCAAVLRDRFDLEQVVFAADGDKRMEKARHAQPCLFSIAFALSELWKSWGVTPGAVLGHSMGEIAAACVAGIFEIDHALRFIATRGELMDSAPGPGEMLAVFAPRCQVEEQLARGPGPAVIAAINGEERLVISGARQAIREHAAAFERRGITTRLLQIALASHSPLMAPIVPALARAAAIPHAAARVPMFLNVDGRVLGAGDALPPGYWSEQILRPVEFARSVRESVQKGHNVFLEVGPHPVLTRLGAEALGAGEQVFIASLSGDKDDRDAIAEALAQLYVAGVDIDWAAVHRGEGRRRIPLPTYPFDRTEYRLEQDSIAEVPGDPPASPLESALLDLWRDVLEQKRARTSDNFFLLGGDSLQVVRLANRIRKKLGRTIPIEWIFRHPTVSELARAMAGSREAARGVRRVRLSTSPAGSHVACIAAPGDGSWRYEALARALSGVALVTVFERSFEVGEPLNIASLAREYAAELSRLDEGRAPSVLVGWSFGGVLAFEIARLLAEAGNQVGTLVLLDSMTPAVIPELTETESFSEGDVAGAEANAQLAATRAALKHYEARPYQGDVVLLAAQEREGGFAPPRDCGWGSVLTGRFLIEHLHCGHYDFVREDVVTKAAETVKHELRRTHGGRWLVPDRPPSRPRARLVCLPHAGAGASLFRRWVERAPDWLQVCRVQLPGREERLQEPLHRSMEEVVRALRSELGEGPPTAIFGHSMGGLIGFELALRLHEDGATPLRFFASAARPPHVPDPHQLHRLPERAFFDALRRRGGMREEILDHAELRELFGQILRADLTLAESWCRGAPLALPVPITVCASRTDDVIPWSVTEEWRACSTQSYERREYSGGHFFLRQHDDAVADLVFAEIACSLRER